MSSKRNTTVEKTLVESPKDEEVDSFDLNAETKAEPTFEEVKVSLMEKVKTHLGTTLKKSGSKFKVGAETEDQKFYRPEFSGHGRQGAEKIWELMCSYIGND